MKTTYKPNIVSPFQRIRQKTDDAFNVRGNKRHPIKTEIANCLGTINLSATIEEDSATLAMFPKVVGLIAFRCLLKRGAEVIGIGRGASVLSKTNRYLEKSVHFAVNASIIDSIAKAAKIGDVFCLEVPASTAPKGLGDAYKAPRGGISEFATDKQKKYLRELVQLNVFDEDKKEVWMSQLGELTREEAGSAIAQFLK